MDTRACVIVEYPKTDMVTEETDIAESLAKFEMANTCCKLFSVNVAGHLIMFYDTVCNA